MAWFTTDSAGEFLISQVLGKSASLFIFDAVEGD